MMVCCRLFTDGVIRNMIDRIRNLIHMREITINQWRPDRVNDNLKLRIKYMRNMISKEDFKKTIQRKEKENQKKGEIYDVLRMFIDCSTEILYRYSDYLENNNIDDPRIEEELNKLRIYANTCLEDISKVYNSKNYVIDINWKII